MEGFVDSSSVVTWVSAVVTVYPPLCAGWRVMVATGLLLLGLSWLESRLRVGSSTSGVQIADMSGMLTLVSIISGTFVGKILSMFNGKTLVLNYSLPFTLLCIEKLVTLSKFEHFDQHLS